MRCPLCYTEVPVTSHYCSDCGALLQFSKTLKLPLQKLLPGSLFAQRFQVIEELGSGGMGIVYRVLDTNVGDEIALKLMRRSGLLAVPKAISVAKQVCEGLAEAHRAGVVHRDLKSSNIMIDENGNVRIMDFGIARSLKTKDETGFGIMIGTPVLSQGERPRIHRLAGNERG
jgi:hypothetical protein